MSSDSCGHKVETESKASCLASGIPQLSGAKSAVPYTYWSDAIDPSADLICFQGSD